VFFSPTTCDCSGTLQNDAFLRQFCSCQVLLKPVNRLIKMHSALSCQMETQLTHSHTHTSVSRTLKAATSYVLVTHRPACLLWVVCLMHICLCSVRQRASSCCVLKPFFSTQLERETQPPPHTHTHTHTFRKSSVSGAGLGAVNPAGPEWVGG